MLDVQLGFAVYAVALLVFLWAWTSARHFSSTHSAPLLVFLFAAAGFGAGLFGGAHFALAARVMSEVARVQPGKTGGMLYAADLLGAAAGALGAALFLLPVYGIPDTLLVQSALSLAGAVCITSLLRYSK
jgi:predicted membrane-bound spermidine synthase